MRNHDRADHLLRPGPINRRDVAHQRSTSERILMQSLFSAESDLCQPNRGVETVITQWESRVHQSGELAFQGEDVDHIQAVLS